MNECGCTRIEVCVEPVGLGGESLVERVKQIHDMDHRSKCNQRNANQPGQSLVLRDGCDAPPSKLSDGFVESFNNQFLRD
jgi:hypothetical protein